MRRYASLDAGERRTAARRLRLVWASSGDREHAAGVARMVADAERVDRRRYGRLPDRAPELEVQARAAYEGIAC